MIGKVFISSIIVIALIFLASSIETSKTNIKEAKLVVSSHEAPYFYNTNEFSASS